ncbi:MAG: FAD-dependent thymidylate synthase [Bdellovibrionales bacterium]|nr:FAD-dependent thymidylate synthase [Bdellovibrionales bacterium]
MSNKTPQVHIYDDLHPEDGAMLQALYSRSPASVVEHVEKVKNNGSGKFMSRYYVGYGHASIGDCGSTNIFIENFSMLAAKAIQDNPLYSGQEASTRYLDFSVQPMKDPYAHQASRKILDEWMNIYNEYLAKTIDALKVKYPFADSQYKKENIWENAIKARGFDTLRGFLPLGTTTLLSWSSNLRQIRDRLMQIKQHPLQEVRDMAHVVFEQILKKYPNSFNGNELSENTEWYGAIDKWRSEHAVRDHYVSPSDLVKQFGITPLEVDKMIAGGIIIRRDTINVEKLNQMEAELLATRPKWADLPRRLEAYGRYNLVFLLDFGSYRDLQRHRNGLCQIPLTEGSFGIFPWYMNELKSLLPADYGNIAERTHAQFERIKNLSKEGVETDVLLDQYLYPMGTSIMCQLTYSVPQMVYVSELRSQKTVHASLRPIAQKIGTILEERHPGIALYIDNDPDTFSEKRGTQTIAEQAVA